MTIDLASRTALLVAARAAIASSLGIAGPDAPTHLSIFDRRCGAFITLTLAGRLRGCIGRVDARAPLRTAIAETARSAAFADPRFAPLDRGDFERVRIAISLLSTPVPVAGVDEVVVGRHGILVEGPSGSRGLLLPQVAVEHGWEREELLSHACAKASLRPDAWQRRDVRVLVFEAEVFRED